jgi:hypothetical protein
MKDAFWLRHDSNAQHDERILELRAEYGWEGYGLFWALVERMRDAHDYRLAMSTMGGLATSMGLLKPKMLAVVELCCTHGLFAMEEAGAYVYSPSLRRRMEEWDTKKAALAEAGKRGQAAKKAKQAEATPPEEVSQAEATLKPPLSHPDVFLSREDKSREEEIREDDKPLPSVEDAASAAAPAPVEEEYSSSTKSTPEPLPESPATELRTPGGAADVGTRKGRAKKDKPTPGSTNPADYQLPEWATTPFVEEFAAYLARRQAMPKPLLAQSIQATLNRLAQWDEPFCRGLLASSAEQNWQGLIFDNTPHKFTQHILATQKLQQDASRINQPERGAKPTEAATFGARSLSAQLRTIREERAAQNGSHVHLGAAAGTHGGLGSPVPTGIGAPQGG